MVIYDRVKDDMSVGHDQAEDGASNNGDPTPHSIFGDSEPPDPQPHVIAAADHVPTHPFWDGRGRGGGRRAGCSGRWARGTSSRVRQRNGSNEDDVASATPPASTPVTALIVDPDEELPAFTGISLRELEFVRRRNTDGAESSVASEDGELVRRRERKRKRKARSGEASRGDVPDEQRMAAAAFGCAGKGGGDGSVARTQRKEGGATAHEYDDDEDAESDYDDEESVAPGSSTFEQCGSFPVRGESCIGCVYDRVVVGKVDAFVREHCGSMTETALYRTASIFWSNEVCAPRATEGVKAPKWHWKDLANHYELHSVDPIMQRTSLVRVLGAMRSYQAQSLLKVNPDGTKQLDAKAADLMLKLVDKQDKQISALDSARMPPPPLRQQR